MKPHPGRLNFLAYPHVVEIQTRFADVDPQWHLNNVRIVELYQEARTSFNLSLWARSSLDGISQRLFVARQSMDYLGEVLWPGAVSIGAGILHTGNSSFSMGLAMFQNDDCVGISDVVLVFVTDRGPTRIPDPMREALATKMLPDTMRS